MMLSNEDRRALDLLNRSELRPQLEAKDRERLAAEHRADAAKRDELLRHWGQRIASDAKALAAQVERDEAAQRAQQIEAAKRADADTKLRSSENHCRKLLSPLERRLFDSRPPEVDEVCNWLDLQTRQLVPGRSARTGSPEGLAQHAPAEFDEATRRKADLLGEARQRLLGEIVYMADPAPACRELKAEVTSGLAEIDRQFEAIAVAALRLANGGPDVQVQAAFKALHSGLATFYHNCAVSIRAALVRWGWAT